MKSLLVLLLAASGAGAQGIVSGGITSVAAIVSGSVDTSKLATDAVTTAKILNAAVDTAKLATDSVTGAKILNATITTGKMADAAVTSAKLANTLTSSMTFTANVQVSTSMAIDGNLLVKSSVTASGLFGDTKGTTGFVPACAAAAGSSAQTAFGVCIATVTVTGYGKAFAVYYSGALVSDSAGATAGANILVDGAFMSGYNTTTGITYQTPALTPRINNSFYVTTPALSAGSHSFCLTLKTSAGTLSTDDSNTSGKICAMELH